MLILALGHRRQVGKDTMANQIARFIKLNHPHIRLKIEGFSDALKDVCYRLYSWAGLEKAIFYEKYPEKKEEVLPDLGVTPREIWIQVGRRLREYDEMVFVNSLLNNQDCDLLIIKDVRYKNELDALVYEDAIIVKIDRQIDRSNPGLFDLPDQELENYQWPIVLDNNGSMQQFRDTVETFIHEYLIPRLKQKRLL